MSQSNTLSLFDSVTVTVRGELPARLPRQDDVLTGTGVLALVGGILLGGFLGVFIPGNDNIFVASVYLAVIVAISVFACHHISKSQLAALRDQADKSYDAFLMGISEEFAAQGYKVLQVTDYGASVRVINSDDVEFTGHLFDLRSGHLSFRLSTGF